MEIPMRGAANFRSPPSLPKAFAAQQGSSKSSERQDGPALPTVIRSPMKVCCARQVVKTQTFPSPAESTVF